MPSASAKRIGMPEPVNIPGRFGSTPPASSSSSCRSRMPWSSSTFGWVAQSLHGDAVGPVRARRRTGSANVCARSCRAGSRSCESSEVGVKSAQSVFDVQRRSRSPRPGRPPPARRSSACSCRRRRSSARTPSRRPSSPPDSRRLKRSNCVGRAAVAVVVAGHDHGRLLAPRQVPEARQRLAVGAHRARSGWPAGAAARRPAGSRPCRGRPSPAARRRPRAEEEVVGADRRRLPSRSWPAQAGLPWRVYTTERARS